MEKEQAEKPTIDALLAKADGGGAARRPLPAFETVDAGDETREPTGTRARPELLKGIHLKVRAELGRRRLQLKDALELGPGAVVDLEKLVDDPVDLYVGDLLVARGEVLVLNDSFCIRVTEVFAQGGGEED